MVTLFCSGELTARLRHPQGALLSLEGRLTMWLTSLVARSLVAAQKDLRCLACNPRACTAGLPFGRLGEREDSKDLASLPAWHLLSLCAVPYATVTHTMTLLYSLT